MIDKVEVIVSSDGSHTLFLPDIDETYHSTHGAIQEAQHVFIKHGIENTLLQNKDISEVSILEVGMGTGLNVLLTALFALEYSDIMFSYHTIEAFPLKWDLVEKLNYTSLLKKGDTLFKKIHKSNWEEKVSISSNFKLTKEKVKLKKFHTAQEFDIVFFDAFAPSRQSEMWEVEQLEIAVVPLKTSGDLITYCANGQFKRNLKSIGLEVTKLPGPPGKREITRGTKV